MHESGEFPDDMDGKMNNSGDEDESYGLFEVGSNERREQNGRRFLENADVGIEDDLRSFLLKEKCVYKN